jgi:hypothetical protein
MTVPGGLRCPVCGARLDESDPRALVCTGHAGSFARENGVYDLRLHRTLPVEPAPVKRRDLEKPFASQDAGAPFIETFEELLRNLGVVESDRLMQILGEGSATWLTTLASTRGDLLYLGNALSGSVPALSASGFDVTALDTSPERVRFGQWRNASRGEERVRSLVGGRTRWLPFGDRAFSVVVVDRGFPGAVPRLRPRPRGRTARVRRRARARGEQSPRLQALDGPAQHPLHPEPDRLRRERDRARGRASARSRASVERSTRPASRGRGPTRSIRTRRISRTSSRSTPASRP